MVGGEEVAISVEVDPSQSISALGLCRASCAFLHHLQRRGGREEKFYCMLLDRGEK